MGFSGTLGTCKIKDGALHGTFFVCHVCPLYWFETKHTMCDKFIPKFSGNKLDDYLYEIFGFGVVIALSMLVFKINYKIVLWIFAIRYIIHVTLVGIVTGFFCIYTSNGAMLNKAGQVVGIFHCKNMILQFSKQLVLVVNHCENPDHNGLIAGNICYVVKKNTFSALYGVNVLILRNNIDNEHPVIIGQIK